MSDYIKKIESYQAKIKEQQTRIDELEVFLKVARIPDSQEWRRKELNEELHASHSRPESANNSG